MGNKLRAASVGAVVLLGFCVPGTASAARKYVCESPTNGYCVATKDSRIIECQCGDGSLHEIEEDGLDTVDDEGLGDACWQAWRDSCLGSSDTVRCKAEDRGKCQAGSSDGGWVDCQCADGRYDGDFSVEALTELDDEELEEACYEHLDDICAPAADQPAPVAAPPQPFTNQETTTSCRVGGSHTPLSLLLLVPLCLARRRARQRV